LGRSGLQFGKEGLKNLGFRLQQTGRQALGGLRGAGSSINEALINAYSNVTARGGALLGQARNIPGGLRGLGGGLRNLGRRFRLRGKGIPTFKAGAGNIKRFLFGGRKYGGLGYTDYPSLYGRAKNLFTPKPGAKFAKGRELITNDPARYNALKNRVAARKPMTPPPVPTPPTPPTPPPPPPVPKPPTKYPDGPFRINAQGQLEPITPGTPPFQQPPPVPPPRPATLRTNQGPAREEEAAEDLVRRILASRQSARPKGTSKIQSAKGEKEALEEAFKRENIDINQFAPTHVKIGRSTKELQKIADDLPGAKDPTLDRRLIVKDTTRGFADPVTDIVALRRGAPRDTAYHEYGHIIDYVLGRKSIYGRATNSPAVQKFTRNIADRIRKSGYSADDVEYLNYATSDSEIFADFVRQILSGNKNRLTDKLRKAAGFQFGGGVPGFGTGDKVHALLEPGEFIMNRNAVSAYGADTFESMNKRVPRFQKGGHVGGKLRMQEGGQVGAAPNMAIPNLGQLTEIMQIFGNKVDLLAESLNNINGLEIQLVATHKVEVIINGAQVLQELQPSIQSLIVSETNVAINNMLKNKFPDVGTVD
jgi:hypothetical protein